MEEVVFRRQELMVALSGGVEGDMRALGSWKAIGSVVNKVFLNVGIVDSSRRAWLFHYNIKHSCTEVCWIGLGLKPMFRNLSSDR